MLAGGGLGLRRRRGAGAFGRSLNEGTVSLWNAGGHVTGALSVTFTGSQLAST